MSLVSLKKTALALSLGMSLVASCHMAIAVDFTDDTDELENTPSMLAMVGDILLARPVLTAMTVVGTAAFVATLPFSAAGGNVKESATMLVLGPAHEAFTRCLGCTETQDRWKKQREAKESAHGIQTDTAANY